MAKAKIEKSNKEKMMAMGASYLRAAVASVLALYLAGITDWKALLNAFVAGFAGPLLKALDPKSEYGKKVK